MEQLSSSILYNIFDNLTYIQLFNIQLLSKFFNKFINTHPKLFHYKLPRKCFTYHDTDDTIHDLLVGSYGIIAGRCNIGQTRMMHCQNGRISHQ